MLFLGSPSIDMAKSIYGLGFDSLGRQIGWCSFVAVDRVVRFCSSSNNMKLSNNNNMKP